MMIVGSSYIIIILTTVLGIGVLASLLDDEKSILNAQVMSKPFLLIIHS
jgi:hypothetical protein